MSEKNETVKKGNRSWKPATLLDAFNKQPGLAYRWVRNDPDNLDRKLAEGWSPVNATSGGLADIKDIDAFKAGKPTTSVRMRRGQILMAMDEETNQSRKAYYKKLADEQLSSTHAETKSNIASTGAPVTGNIQIIS